MLQSALPTQWIAHNDQHFRLAVWPNYLVQNSGRIGHLGHRPRGHKAACVQNIKAHVGQLLQIGYFLFR